MSPLARLSAAGLALLLCGPAVARAQSAPTKTQPPAESAPDQDLVIEGLEVQKGGLTAAMTATRALAASSTVREKRAQLAAAQAQIAQTTVEFFPKLALRASYTRLSSSETSFGSGALVGAANGGPLRPAPAGDACGAEACIVDARGTPVVASAFDIQVLEDNYALAANLTIPLSDYVLRVADAAASASSSREAARFALLAEQRKVKTDAQVLYYQWLRAQAQTFIAKRAVERTRARHADAQAAFSVGRLSNADVLRFEAQVARTELALTQVESLRALTEAQLAIVMQDAAGTAYAVGQGVPRADTPELAEREQGKRLVAEALQNRLELKAVDASTRALERGQDAVEAGAWPRITAVGEALYANPNPRYFPPVQAWRPTWTVGIAATYNLDDPFMADARASELGANLEATRAQRRGLENAVTSEVISAELELVKNKAAIASIETALRAAEESYRVTSELFRVGRATPTDVIDAESDLFGAKAQLADARIESVIALLRFAQALGRDPEPKPR